MTRKLFSLALLGLGVLGAGCGQTSYFSVDVIVGGPTGRIPNMMKQIQYAEVKPEGAVSDGSSFDLTNIPEDDYSGNRRDSNQQIILGKFQYGTTSESGKVKFTVTLLNGSRTTLGSGSNGDGDDIQSGGNKAISVTVNPDDSVWQ